MKQARKESTRESSYKPASIDVHKAMLAVVIADAAELGEFHFERRKFGAAPGSEGAGRVADSAGGAGSGGGIHRPVLEACVAGTGR